MKKLFAVVMAVLTSLGLAWAQAWNHDPASPIGSLHWGTVALSYATCGDSITVGRNKSSHRSTSFPTTYLRRAFSIRCLSTNRLC